MESGNAKNQSDYDYGEQIRLDMAFPSGKQVILASSKLLGDHTAEQPTVR